MEEMAKLCDSISDAAVSGGMTTQLFGVEKTPCQIVYGSALAPTHRVVIVERIMAASIDVVS